MIRKLDLRKPHQLYFTRDGHGPLPGASTICKYGEDTGGLIHWAWRKGKDGIDYRSERDAAAQSGTIAHALSEAYLIGDELDLSEFSLEAQALGHEAFEQFKAWWIAEKMTFLHSELQLASDVHEFGGTLDIAGRNPIKETCLIDLKRVKSIRTSHAIQVVGGYKTLYEEHYPDDPIDRVCILRLPTETNPSLEATWLPPETFAYYKQSFLANLTAYKARQSLDKVCPIALASPWFNRKKK